MPIPRLKPLSLVLAALVAQGCGGSAPAREAATPYEPGPAGLERALADLDRAEVQIAERFGGVATAAGSQGYPQAQPSQATAPESSYAQPPPPAQPSPAPQAAPPAPPRGSAPSADEDDGDDAEGRERDQQCALACRALGSMQRAAEHVCRAAGPSDARCGRARQRVTAAEEKVSASCDDC